MPPNIDKVIKIDFENLDEPADINKAYDLVTELDVDDVEDLEKIRHIFKVTQSVMNSKVLELESISEDAEKNIERLKELESENRHLHRMESTMGGGDDKYHELYKERVAIENDRDEFEKKLQDAESREYELNQENEKLNEKMGQLEENLAIITADKNRLDQDIEVLSRQVQQWQEKASGARGGDEATKREMANLRAQLRRKEADVDLLEEQKHTLEIDLEKLSSNLKMATDDMERTADEYQKMKSIVKDNDHLLEDRTKECEHLKLQVAELSEQIRRKGDNDDEIMIALNNKVEEWKQLLSDRDSEIIHLFNENKKLRHEIASSDVDADKATMNAMIKLNSELNSQIQQLKEQLKEATIQIEEDIKQMEELSKTGRGPIDRQAERIRELTRICSEKEDQLKEWKERTRVAEREAEDREREKDDQVERMRQYEEGEYGLAQAVAEIKERNALINARDRQLEDYVQHINKNEMEINDLKDENEHLRVQLGMPLDEKVNLAEFKRGKAIRAQERRAEDLVLENQIERLEDERLALRKQVRALAKQIGQRAGSAGIDVEDMLDVDKLMRDTYDGGSASAAFDVTDGVRVSRATRQYTMERKESRGNMGHDSTEDVRSRFRVMDEEISKYMKELNLASSKIAELETQLSHFARENAVLETGLRETKVALTERASDIKGVLECPSLDKLLSALDAKKLMGEFDTGLYLKTRVDRLEGMADELRRELRESRVETTKAKIAQEKAESNVQRLQADINALKEMGAGSASINLLSLPQGLAATSQEVISLLNEQLVQVLQEVSLKEDMLKKNDAALEQYRRKFALARHQLGLVYKEFYEEKSKWTEEKSHLVTQSSKHESQHAEDVVRLEEFERLIDTLSRDESEVRRRLAEQSRQITVLRVNEQKLIRRYTTLQDTEQLLKRDLNRLRNDEIQMEAAVTGRLGYYQRYKDMAAFKISALQKALDDSISKIEFNRLQQRFDELTEKYRDFLEKSNSLVSRSETFVTLEVEAKQLRLDNEAVKKQLEIDRQRLHTLEAAFEELNQQGVAGAKQITESHLISISKKLTTLEMKELNERERADHATRLLDTIKLSTAELERRNKDLEDRFAEATRISLEQQRTERSLRDELAVCVPKAVSDGDKKKIGELQESEIKLKHEVEKLKEVTEIAQAQSRIFQDQQISRDKEVTAMRNQLNDFYCETEEKSVIGKLHRHIVQLQLSEATALRKLENANTKLRRLETQLLRTEHRIDERDETLYHNRLESRSKVKHLKDTINSLRSQFAGSVPLARQEKFTKTLLELQEEKSRAHLELNQALEKRLEVEAECSALRIKHEGLEELMSAIKDGRGSQKVVEWHGKMEQLRLERSRFERDVGLLRQQIRHLESVIRTQESQIQALEKESASAQKEFEERQISWELRENELERLVMYMEQAQVEVTGAAGRLEAAHGGSMPDTTLPLPNQLDQAINTIKKNVKTIFDQQSEIKVVKKQCRDLQEQIKGLEKQLLQRERYITELRIRLPATIDRDEQFSNLSAAAQRAAAEVTSDNYVEDKTLSAAQTSVNALQSRLHQKEESLEKTRDLLKNANLEIEELHKRHAEQMLVMQRRLDEYSDKRVSQLTEQVSHIRKDLTDNSNVTAEQLTRLHEMEELVAEQNKALAVQSNNVREARLLAEEHRLQYERLVRANQEESNRHSEEHKQQVQSLQIDISNLNAQILECKAESAAARKEMEFQKQENRRAPSTQLRNEVANLRALVKEKEAQQRSLSKALTELRADMVKQAEELLKTTTSEMRREGDLKDILDKHTKELSDELNSTKEALNRARVDLKAAKGERDAFQEENDVIKRDQTRKKGILAQVKADSAALQTKYEDIVKQLERMKNLRKLAPNEEAKRELDELRRKVRSLEEENRRKRLHPAEKPYEDEPLIQAEKTNKLSSAAPTAGMRSSGANLDKKDESRLRKKLHSVESELERANREIESLNRQLERSQSKAHHNTDSTSLQPAASVQIDRLMEQRRHLQQCNLDLDQLNVEYKCELDAARLEIPRLKNKVEELTKYTELLKAEKQNLEQGGGTNRSLGSTTSSVGNLKRLGESGYSTKELEKKIAMMKKVLERTIHENERLKAAPGIVSNAQLQAERQENEALKAQLADLRQQVGSKLADRYNATERGTVKLMQDFEKLRKELKSEHVEHDATRVQLQHVNVELEASRRENLELRQRLEIAEAKHASWGVEAEARGGWTKAVAIRQDERQRSQMETDLDKKSHIIVELKQLLRDAAEREQAWLQEKQHLQRRTTLDNGATDATRQALLIERLLAQKAVLTDQLERAAGPNASPINDELLYAVEERDRLLQENVQLRLDWRQAEMSRSTLEKDYQKLICERK